MVDELHPPGGEGVQTGVPGRRAGHGEARLGELGPEIQWVESQVTQDKIYCVYRAPNEEMIREHARRGGFPANKISQIRALIDPTTAE